MNIIVYLKAQLNEFLKYFAGKSKSRKIRSARSQENIHLIRLVEESEMFIHQLTLTPS